MTEPGHQTDPTIYACKAELFFGEPITATEAKNRIEGFLSELTGTLRKNGCTLIGHVKGLIHADDHGHLMFSITSFEDPIRFKGKMLDGITKAALTVNVIVYGVDQTAVEDASQNLLRKHFGT